MSAALGILAMFVLTAGTALFVAQEFAYVSADRVELSRQAAAGDKRAASAVRVMERLSFMLSAAQTGITVTGLLVGFIAEPAIAAALRPLLSGFGMSPGAISATSVAVGFVVATTIQMVLGELFPKNLAIAKPETLAKALAPVTHVYMAISGPVVRIFDSSASWLLRKVGIEPVEELHHGATVEELGQLIGESERHGELSARLSGVLGRAITFSERTAGEAMIARPDVRSVHAGQPASDVIDLIAEGGHSNYPVFGETSDDIVGVVGVRDLVRLSPAESSSAVSTVARSALMVPDSVPLRSVVTQMSERDDEFACVVDEYGGLAGIVTLEDIAEELIGDITDETDNKAVAATENATGWWELDAVLRVDEAAEVTGIGLPESEDYDTVAGLIVAELGRFPEAGDRFTLAADPEIGRLVAVDFEIVTVERHVPEMVRLRRSPDQAEVDA